MGSTAEVVVQAHGSEQAVGPIQVQGLGEQDLVEAAGAGEHPIVEQ